MSLFSYLVFSLLTAYCHANSPSYAPNFMPSYAPTSIPTPVVELEVSQDPIAKHQLVVIPSAGNQVIQLTFYDTTTTRFSYYITSIPASGSLYQLSQVYSNYGYEPKNGVLISATEDTLVTGSNHRVYYTRPSPDVAGINKWGTFSFYIVRYDGTTSQHPGTITLVPSSGNLIGSNFLLGTDSWTITGNKVASSSPTYEPYSRGSLLNYYIVGQDNLINVAGALQPDTSLWYFEAPAAYYGNQGIAYGGSFSFSIGSFSGDFSNLNALSTQVVILECATCQGPITQGIRLGYNMTTLSKSGNGLFTGSPMTISINLLENGGWLKDPQDTLKSWSTPSKCDMIQVLSRLSKIKILGDYTTWYETVAIDNVQIANKKGQLPVCAMQEADASVCTC